MVATKDCGLDALVELEDEAKPTRLKLAGPKLRITATAVDFVDEFLAVGLFAQKRNEFLEYERRNPQVAYTTWYFRPEAKQLRHCRKLREMRLVQALDRAESMAEVVEVLPFRLPSVWAELNLSGLQVSGVQPL